MWWRNMRGIGYRSDSLILARASHNNAKKAFDFQVFFAVFVFRYRSPASAAHRQAFVLS
jgi:hypothetical protein